MPYTRRFVVSRTKEGTPKGFEDVVVDQPSQGDEVWALISDFSGGKIPFEVVLESVMSAMDFIDQQPEGSSIDIIGLMNAKEGVKIEAAFHDVREGVSRAVLNKFFPGDTEDKTLTQQAIERLLNSEKRGLIISVNATAVLEWLINGLQAATHRQVLHRRSLQEAISSARIYRDQEAQKKKAKTK
jgi:hypothetical protein